jgi:LacI family transcriptional regulator
MGRVVVGIVMNAVSGYSRGVLKGVASFAAARGWSLRVHGINEAEVDLEGKRWTGIIVQAATKAQVSVFSRARVPVVNISSSIPDVGLPTVINDDLAVGRIGADHLLRRGYRTLLFYAPDRRAFAKMRQEGFWQRAAEAGVEPSVVARDVDLAAALGESARPLGVMGCNDRAALAVVESCRDLRLRVPEDVAVLGVDDDDLVQTLAYPGLSTVNTARDRVGFEAAKMLEQLLHRSGHGGTLLVAPKGIVARKSTDAAAIADPDVAEAARYIHANAQRAISVTDVMRAVPMSRRQLERRFRAVMGRTMLEEITRCRVDRARQLLIDGDLTLEQVALSSGFASASYFSVVFKRLAGETPLRFRELHRMGR